MDVKKVLYISQEIDPYLPGTPLGIYTKSLAESAQEHGAEVRTFMPKYTAINERRNQLHEVIRLSGLNIIIDDTDHPLIIKVATLQPARLQVYFIDNDDYFDERDLAALSFPDDDERSIFFARGVIETVRKLRWEPTVVQCTGWLTAAVPAYVKTYYADDPAFRQSKVVYALFGQHVAGTLDSRLPEKLIQDEFAPEQLRTLSEAGTIDYLTLNKFAMDYADAIVEASDDVPVELVEYARATGKPFMAYEQAKEGPDAYNEFYKSL